MQRERRKSMQIEQAMTEAEIHKSHEKIDTADAENPRYESFLHKSETTQKSQQQADSKEHQ